MCGQWCCCLHTYTDFKKGKITKFENIGNLFQFYGYENSFD